MPMLRAMACYGCDHNRLKIMPGLFLLSTVRGRKRKVNSNSCRTPSYRTSLFSFLSYRIDYDLSGLDVDRPLPEIPRRALSSSRVE
jgi:hypothetical protein